MAESKVNSFKNHLTSLKSLKRARGGDVSPEPAESGQVDSTTTTKHDTTALDPSCDSGQGPKPRHRRANSIEIASPTMVRRRARTAVPSAPSVGTLTAADRVKLMKANTDKIRNQRATVDTIAWSRSVPTVTVETAPEEIATSTPSQTVEENGRHVSRSNSISTDSPSTGRRRANTSGPPKPKQVKHATMTAADRVKLMKANTDKLRSQRTQGDLPTADKPAALAPVGSLKLAERKVTISKLTLLRQKAEARRRQKLVRSQRKLESTMNRVALQDKLESFVNGVTALENQLKAEAEQRLKLEAELAQLRSAQCTSPRVQASDYSDVVVFTTGALQSLRDSAKAESSSTLLAQVETVISQREVLLASGGHPVQTTTNTTTTTMQVPPAPTITPPPDAPAPPPMPVMELGDTSAPERPSVNLLAALQGASPLRAVELTGEGDNKALQSSPLGGLFSSLQETVKLAMDLRKRAMEADDEFDEFDDDYDDDMFGSSDDEDIAALEWLAEEHRLHQSQDRSK